MTVPLVRPTRCLQSCETGRLRLLGVVDAFLTRAPRAWLIACRTSRILA
jgi:hypothetical protein